WPPVRPRPRPPPVPYTTLFRSVRLRRRNRRRVRAARDRLHAPARHQPAAGMERAEGHGMTVAARPLPATRSREQRRLTEPPIVRWTLIAVAIGFLTLFLAIPLVAVFVEAFANGFGAYVSAIVEPDALAALRLTLLTAAIAVPA